MIINSPRHGTRDTPEAAGLEASLHHIGGWPAISITDSPQTIEITLTNRTPHPAHMDIARIALLFRPGILMDLDALALAPQSEAQWVLSLYRADTGEAELRLDSAAALLLAPGETTAIRIAGISASPAGGSRATRVQLSYDRIFHDEGPEVTGTHLIHLPVLRRHADDPLPMRQVRGGSATQSGPFTAGFVEGHGVLNDGKSPNPLKLRLRNTSGRSLRLSGQGDAATRLHLSWSTGRPGGEWGLLASRGDHVTVTMPKEGASDQNWQLDGHTLRRTQDGTLRDGQGIDLDLVVHSQAEPGQAQLVVTFENLPDYDDGDLVLLVDLGPMAAKPGALNIVTPVNLHGDDARLRFHTAEPFAVETDPEETASIAVNRTPGDAGRLEIKGAPGRKTGYADVSIGDTDASFLGLSYNAIFGYQNGRAGRLVLQPDGRETVISGSLSVGLSKVPTDAQDRQPPADNRDAVRIQDNHINGIYRNFEAQFYSDLYLQSNEHNTIVGGDMSVSGQLHVKQDASHSDNALIVGLTNGQTTHVNGNGITAANAGQPEPVAIGLNTRTSESVHIAGNAIFASVLRNQGQRQNTLSLQFHGAKTLIGGALDIKGPVNITTPTDTSVTKAGAFTIGDLNGESLSIDGNEIVARDKNNSPSTLYLNKESGRTAVLGRLSIANMPTRNSGTDVTWTSNEEGGLLGIESSSRRYKKNIAKLKDDFSKLLSVTPRRFKMRNAVDPSDQEQIGYIAEELHDLGLERLTLYDEEGRPDGVKYKMIALYLTEIVKTHEARISALEATLDSLATSAKGGRTSSRTRKRGS